MVVKQQAGCDKRLVTTQKWAVVAHDNPLPCPNLLHPKSGIIFTNSERVDGVACAKPASQLRVRLSAGLRANTDQPQCIDCSIELSLIPSFHAFTAIHMRPAGRGGGNRGRE